MRGVKELLKNYKSAFFIRAKKLKFRGIGRNDVYNITAPFKIKKTEYLFGRVEPHEFPNSKIVLFRKRKNYWVPDEKFKELFLEDPFFTTIGDLFVLGGVEVEKKNEKLRYRTAFYRGKEIHSLKRFAYGPWGMKDIRLVELPNDGIGVFTRPQGKKGRRGKIGFTIIDSLSKLTPRKLSSAELIRGQFYRGEWGGVNQAMVLDNGKLGILGHIARYSKDKKNRFYYPVVFCFDYFRWEKTPLKIILRRAELPEGEAKTPGLYNVIFPGGIIREGENAKLYVGVGDAEAYEVTIKDPFKTYETGIKE